MKKDPVITAAIRWWKNRRPLAWDQATHLKHPKVNTVTEVEARLAATVATHIKKTT